ncbi:hypothetical protein EDD85DRAFT_962806 [Armillaria nabsnona]|nr:hypothetical protein EDD85DRAFT_962806 [Armillaria nabsnona]
MQYFLYVNVEGKKTMTIFAMLIHEESMGWPFPVTIQRNTTPQSRVDNALSNAINPIGLSDGKTPDKLDKETEAELLNENIEEVKQTWEKKLAKMCKKWNAPACHLLTQVKVSWNAKNRRLQEIFLCQCDLTIESSPADCDNVLIQKASGFRAEDWMISLKILYEQWTMLSLLASSEDSTPKGNSSSLDECIGYSDVPKMFTSIQSSEGRQEP